MAVQLEREGARCSVTQTTASAVCRTSADGVNLRLEVCSDPEFTTQVAISTGNQIGSLTAANNYQATAYVDGLSPGVLYYWRVRADDGAGDEAIGSSSLHSGSFTTDHDTAEKPFRVGFIGCLYGQQASGNSDLANRAQKCAANIRKLNLDRLAFIGDIYYSDVGNERNSANTTPYVANGWATQPNDTSVTVAERVERMRTNFITSLDGVKHQGKTVGYDDVCSDQPMLYMWDDHDFGLNDRVRYDVETAAGQDAAEAGQQVGFECFMDLMRDHVVASRDATYDWDVDGYVDLPPVRFIFLDVRSFRDRTGDPDTGTVENPDKTMLGADQLSWLKNVIAEKAQPFTILCSPVMGDGDHGRWYDEPPSKDCWKDYSYEWQHILKTIREDGDPCRTCIVSLDTHSSAVLRWAHGAPGERNQDPIYEVMASNHWMQSYHGYLTGCSSESKREGGERIAAVGYGAELHLAATRANNMVLVEAWPGGMRVSLIHHYEQTGHWGDVWLGEQNNRVVWSKEYT